MLSAFKRYAVFVSAILVTPAWGLLAWSFHPAFMVPFAIFFALCVLGVVDITQKRRSIRRNYPIIGRLRYIFESIRPEIRQYLIEGDKDEMPFSREMRSLVYQRAKGEEDKRPFGTSEKVYEQGYSWLTHSIAPQSIPDTDFKVVIGGPDCPQPYRASIYNISAMSFGSLSANAILALNSGAKQGGFAHDTGEGGVSIYHKKGGGDLIYQVASGYFGCRDTNGKFCPAAFQDQASNPQIKMIEIKLSQGAKPGHGGMLPASKITPEIAQARGIPMGRDCVSPAAHSAFSNPTEFVKFMRQLRDLSGGKPVGFKLCIGHRREFMCILKAMLREEIYPDFIVVDGKEGGTGAAPLEFTNRVGMPMLEGLAFVHNALRGAGIRNRIKIGAAGKIVSAYDIARALALGADWCNSARGFMFAIGCIQAQACHTNKCPVGIATQDKLRQRALDPDNKAQRVARFHANTLKALGEIAGAAGLTHPDQFLPYHFAFRENGTTPSDGNEIYPYLPEGFLVDGSIHENLADWHARWNRSNPDSFAPPKVYHGVYD